MNYIDIHTHKVLSRKGDVMVSNLFPEDWSKLKSNKYYSIGLHPWFIQKDSCHDQLKQIHELAMKKEVVAIGEAGIDKVVATPFELQMEVFEKQIKIAESINKPLIIHCVRAFNEVIQLKKKIRPKVPWIIHGYNSKPEIAKMLLMHNVYLSFGNSIMYPLSNAAEILSIIPNDKFFLETDDHEFDIEDIYKSASVIKKIRLENLKSIILQNFKNCFGIEHG